ncbi:MAG: 3-isopropylmalate dehydratase small subunit [Alphaproteobacteria bacterium]
MEPFTVLTAAAVPIDSPNVDTDQIIPARFLKQPRGDGYGRFLFHDLRRNEDGSLKRDFILNRKPFAQARIMVGERNFGCGSSREGAVYAMVDHGFRAVIAPSFGDIFHNNCCKNGVLPIVVSAGLAADLRGQLHAAPGATMTIDLEAQTLTAPDGAAHDFAVDPFHKHCLLEGLDDIRLTLEYETDITAFEASASAEAPWL